MLTSLNIDPNTEVYTLEGEAKSFLYFACHNHQKGIVRLLLAKGANIILDHNSGMTVFHTALTAQHFDMAAFLIENGADPNYVKGDNMTYLEICTFLYLNIAMVTKLLAYGANMEFIRCEKTAFKSLVDLTRELNDRKQSTDMVKVFVQYGANSDILDLDGQMVRDKEAIYEPLKALLTLESVFRKNDYKKIKAIDKKDLAAFVQWKAAILPVVKDISKDEYIKRLLELYKFSNQMSLDSDDSIQPLIELEEKIAKLIPPLEFLCILKIEDIIYSNATDKIELPESAIKAMTEYGLL
ncbi:ankyrin repeat domain-containing protein [Rickettsia koreansis]|uniref:ankyrin repeat domain-containing protein n=1 Tax=Rickettsia koreansis TaxID=2358204 RepID=UPI00397BDC98